MASAELGASSKDILAGSCIRCDRVCAPVWCRSVRTNLNRCSIKRVDACYHWLPTKHTHILIAHFIWYHPTSGEAQLHQRPQSKTSLTRNSVPKTISEMSPLQKTSSFLRGIVVNCRYTHHTNPSGFPIFHCRIWSTTTRLRPLRNAWVQLNRLRTGVGRFVANMKSMGLCGSHLCKCGKVQKTPNILHD